MSGDYNLTEDDRADIHSRLASWFGDDRQAFLVSHLAPVIDRIKSDACAQAVAEALEMSRKAEQSERRAEDTEAEIERLRAALVGHLAECHCSPPYADCPHPPCDCWVCTVLPLEDCSHEWIGRPESDTATCDLCGAEEAG